MQDSIFANQLISVYTCNIVHLKYCEIQGNGYTQPMPLTCHYSFQRVGGLLTVRLRILGLKGQYDPHLEFPGGGGVQSKNPPLEILNTAVLSGPAPEFF